jgi:hypothetical protein
MRIGTLISLSSHTPTDGIFSPDITDSVVPRDLLATSPTYVWCGTADNSEHVSGALSHEACIIQNNYKSSCIVNEDTGTECDEGLCHVCPVGKGKKKTLFLPLTGLSDAVSKDLKQTCYIEPLLTN